MGHRHQSIHGGGFLSVFQVSFSILKLLLTQRMVKIVQIPAHILGTAHPSPYATSFFTVKISASKTTPTIIEGMPQNHTNWISIFLKRGELLYRCKSASR